ncbi:MAG: Smr/MutS family protein [Thiotrichaceae bacterium]
MCKKPTSSPQEANEFHNAMSGVEPLRHDKVIHDTPKPRAVPIKSIEDEQLVLKDMLSDEYEPLDLQAGDILSYCDVGLQRKVFRKLRRGHYRITDELDLHGMNAKQAKEMLLPYLQEVKQLAGCCLRIIHGKGNRSADKGPVLKRKVDHWLQLHGRVLAYHSALPCDGGTGAVYVLLKRQY